MLQKALAVQDAFLILGAIFITAALHSLCLVLRCVSSAPVLAATCNS